ncbi:MAG TPA: extracellular solute-binding protein [Leptolyngbyaceae cyanobacterium]
MKRRSFLIGSSSLIVSSLVSGCNARQTSLKVRLLEGSIPAQLLREFQKKLAGTVNLDFAPETQLSSLFGQLQAWQKKPENNDWWSNLPIPLVGGKKITPIADLVTLGDYWLAEAIRQNLIQPLDPQQLSQWQQLPPVWQTLVKRDRQGKLDPKGKVWGAPYRWGTTVIVYRRDKFKANGWSPPTDWGDLWREELRDRISVLDRPRETIGLTLKKLGLSYNSENLDKILPKLTQELFALDRQVKFYSSDTYLQPLILGDTYVAVGWSSDILPVMQRYHDLAAVVPQSGTALWADLWVRPNQTNTNQNLLQTWIDFCWQPDIARLLSRFGSGASPILVGDNQAESPNSPKNQVILPKQEIIQKSEFLQPLSPATLKIYQNLWNQIR